MASSENLASIDPWVFRPTFNDCWISELVARDADTLTKALQKSLANATTTTQPETQPSISDGSLKPEPVQTPTVSGLSGSDPESTAPKRQKNPVPPAAGGKVSKRKSRATKKTQTTFITADPANFRQMVQQVTGVRFGTAQFPVVSAPILKPEPQRACSRFPITGGCLPTLDTSALLLDHHHSQQQPLVGSTTTATGPMSSLVGSAPPPSQPSTLSSFAQNLAMADVGGLDFDTFPTFPTLESWKVM